MWARGRGYKLREGWSEAGQRLCMCQELVAGTLSIHRHRSLNKMPFSRSLCGLRMQITHLTPPQSAQLIKNQASDLSREPGATLENKIEIEGERGCTAGHHGLSVESLSEF